MVEKERKKQIKKLAKQEELYDEDVYDMEENDTGACLSMW